MPKRKNPRTPATIYQLRERLKKLNDSRRSPLSAATLWSTGMPPLSAATLWSITYAGLWHVAGRDPALAARWLKVLEKAVQVEGGGLLTGGGPWQRPALERDIDSFAKEDLAPWKAEGRY
jgi:hypothetical protein